MNLTKNKQIPQWNAHLPSASLSSSLEENLSFLKETFADSDDMVFYATEFDHQPACLVYLSEMVNEETLLEIKQSLVAYPPHQESMHRLSNGDPMNDLKSVVVRILSGDTILMVDNMDHALSFHSTNAKGRDVTEPDTEPSIKGPKEGFVEDIQTNLRLIRRKIRTPSLKVDHLTIGEQTHTQIAVVYMKGIADDGIVEEVHRRLSRIDIDGVLDSQYLESMMKDAPRSPFPTVFSTERPDRVCGGLLDGKVAVITDGTPFAFTAPATFVEFLHSGEDYYDSSLTATIVRWVRFIGLFVTLILPAFYIALTTFQQDLLQTPFLLRIAANREGLPYPILIEGIFMILAYEMVREAGLRMPKVFGGGITSILGLLLLTQIAVTAGIVGPGMAAVVAATEIISFLLPNYAFHQIIRYCGIPFMILAGLFGFMGILVGLMFALTHLVSLRSFGVPYFSPVSPARRKGWKDVFIRAPWWAIDTRVPGFDVGNFVRADEGNQTAKPSKAGKEDRE